MEQIEAILGFEWNSMSGICSSDEAEFTAQLLSNSLISNGKPSDSRFPTIWQSHESSNSFDNGRSMYHSPDETTASVYSFPFSSSYCHDMSRQDFVNGDSFTIMDFCKENNECLNMDVSNDSLESNENVSEGSARYWNVMAEGFGGDIMISNMPQISTDDTIGGLSGSKKRSRASAEIHRNEKCIKLKKCVNNVDDNDDDKNCSEDDSNSNTNSHEPNELAPASCSVRSKGGGAHKSTGKTRASRGSATDPQSLYARKRREKINERLRILQNLIPNGTKVDISTMLEEAVQYVKFLQLQIKLLSSEDLWIYAPIAYNGMEIGDLKISTPKPQSL